MADTSKTTELIDAARKGGPNFWLLLIFAGTMAFVLWSNHVRLEYILQRLGATLEVISTEAKRQTEFDERYADRWLSAVEKNGQYLERIAAGIEKHEPQR